MDWLFQPNRSVQFLVQIWKNLISKLMLKYIQDITSSIFLMLAEPVRFMHVGN